MYRIYCLLDPTTLEPRYVGQTGQTLKARLKWFSASDSPVRHWIDELTEEPIIAELDTAETKPESLDKEASYIKALRELGYQLLNVKDDDRVGWPGFAGHTQSDYQKSVMSAIGHANAGRPRPDLAERNRQREWTEEQREDVSAKTRAAMQDPAVRAKLEAYWDRRWPNRNKR